MTFLDRGRVLTRAWSVRVAAIGAALYALLLTIDPAALQAGWQSLPPELRGLIPAHIDKWITLALFIGVAIARGLHQPKVVERLSLLPTPMPTPAWLTAVRATCWRKITSIAVHCSATPEGRPHTAADIRSWHKAQGWSDIGYHFVVRLDGTVETGRPIGQIGAHVAGHNSTSIGVCYVGGVAVDGKTPKDTRTPAQKVALLSLLAELKRRFPAAVIQGHRDYPKVAKACPSFDAKTEYAGLKA